jgi:hypothetical protein
MILKKMVSVFFTICCIALFSYNLANAGGWDQCKGCHNGKLAPNAKELKEKYVTVDKLVAAAKSSGNSSMESMKKNESRLRKAAKNINLKQTY